jgi:hypothetical protein
MATETLPNTSPQQPRQLQPIEASMLTGNLVVPDNIQYLRHHPEALQALEDLIALMSPEADAKRRKDKQAFEDPEVAELNSAIAAEVEAERNTNPNSNIEKHAQENTRRTVELKDLMDMLGIKEGSTLEEKYAKQAMIKDVFRRASESARRLTGEVATLPEIDPSDLDSINAVLEIFNTKPVEELRNN